MLDFVEQVGDVIMEADETCVWVPEAVEGVCKKWQDDPTLGNRTPLNTDRVRLSSRV